jgi:hypothetical protein
MQETAALFGVSEATVYRALQHPGKPRALQRADRGLPRILPRAERERSVELSAAIKVRTAKRKGRHLSTSDAIRLLEEDGLETPSGLVPVPQGVLKRPTVNAYLRQWGYDWGTLRREPPAIRFQARDSNKLWQLDMRPSDLKQLKPPPWVDAGQGPPTLMLYRVVDDRSGVAYQEEHTTWKVMSQISDALKNPCFEIKGLRK